MKRVTLTYDTRNATGPLYKNSQEEKSQSYNDYVTFLENNSSNIELSISGDGLLSVVVDYTDQNYEEYLTVYSAVSEEIDQYNSANNIIVTTTVTDVNE